MKKVLLVTGRNAKGIVTKYSQMADVPHMVHSCNVNVAALLSPAMILDEISKLNLRDISTIIVPGAVKGDVSMINKKLRIPCFKGPVNVADLPLVLGKVNSGLQLSVTVPANEILENDIIKESSKELESAYKPKVYALKIGHKNPVFLGSEISHIIAEIPNAPRLTDKEIAMTAKYYLDSGAEIIDIGMIVGEDNSKDIPRILDAVKSVVSTPLSIDSLNRDEILAAVDSGIDLILSIDLTNYEMLDSIDIPVVVIPRDEKGIVPEKPDERIAIIEKLIEKNNNKNLIVDMILDPLNIGFVKSVDAFIEFRKKYPDMPMMIGAGNVTELIDADSIGVNALIAGIASELNINLIFTTEASNKTRGCIKELSTAVKMMYLSKKRNQPPKDVGIDLLMLKDKKRIETPMDFGKIPKINAKKRKLVPEDATFSIFLSDNEINAVYHKNKNPELRLSGKKADGLYMEIISRNLIKGMDHAAYLGKELEKAEIALKLGKNYVQDKELF